MDKLTIQILSVFLATAVCFAFVGITRIASAIISLDKIYNYTGPSGYEAKQSWKKLLWGIIIVTIFISIATAIATYLVIKK